MPNHLVSRRQAITMAGAGGLAAWTGCSHRAVETVGEALVSVGGLVLTIPHLAGKIIGAILTASGTALKLYVVTMRGVESEVVIELTEEQQRKIREALDAGKKINIKQPDGSKDTIEPKE